MIEYELLDLTAGSINRLMARDVPIGSLASALEDAMFAHFLASSFKVLANVSQQAWGRPCKKLYSY